MASAGVGDGHQDSHQAGQYRRIELISGEARRRRWTAEEKAEILAESFQPGARVSEVARRHGMNRGLLWSWRHQARKHAAAERMFVPIRSTGEAAAQPTLMAVAGHEDAASAGAAQPGGTGAWSSSGVIEIEVGGAHVRVHGAVDTAALRQVLTHFGRRG